MAKKKAKGCLTYFLDHPQIKRHESPGNGNVPGSMAAKINFGGKNTTASNPTPSSASSSTPKPASAAPSSDGSSIASKINFGGKFKK
jgi:hypothetical protein